MEEIYEKINSLKILDTIVIEFGVFDENGNEKLKVNVLNTDDTTTEVEMKVEDIMYYTEYGTMTIPPKHLFRTVRELIMPRLDAINSSILNSAFTNGITENEVLSIFNAFQNEITYSIIPLAVQNVIASNSTITTLLESNEEQKYLLSLNVLKKFIKCKIFFKK